ncbi:Ig-like domain-containing protein, partial [Marinoscillum furvescens]
TFMVNVDFSEVVSGFDVSDITVTNGSASNLFTSDSIGFTVDISPTADGLVSVDVGAGVVTDGAGNNNTAATTYSITYDNTPPTVAISDAPASISVEDTITVTVDFSEIVTGFALSDVVATNATLGGLSTSNSINYTMDVYPSGGDIAIDIASDVVQDAAGNGNQTMMTIAISVCNPPNISLTIDDNRNCVNSNGEIAVTASTFGGEPSSYQIQLDQSRNLLELYTVNDGSVPTIFDSLEAGSYSVVVRNNDNTMCSADTSITIIDAVDSLVIDSLLVAVTPESGTLFADGAFDASGAVSGGSGNYSYAWVSSLPVATPDTLSTLSAPSGLTYWPQSEALNLNDYLMLGTFSSSNLVSQDLPNYVLLVSDSVTGCTASQQLQLPVQQSLVTVNALPLEDRYINEGGNVGEVIAWKLRIDVESADLYPSYIHNVIDGIANNGDIKPTINWYRNTTDDFSSATQVTSLSNTLSYFEGNSEYSFEAVDTLYGQQMKYEAGTSTYMYMTLELADTAKLGADFYVKDLLSANADSSFGFVTAYGQMSFSIGETNPGRRFLIVNDSVPPSVTLSTLVANNTNSDSIGVTMTLSEPVSAFDASVFTVTNGSVTNLTGSDSSYTFAVIPVVDGIVSVGLDTAVITDLAGNGNRPSNELQWIVDTTEPVVGVDSKFTADGSPELTGTVDDSNAQISITVNGQTHAAVNNQNGTWTLASGTITPDLSFGTYDVVAQATDSVGNIGFDQTIDELTIDGTAPVITAFDLLTNAPSPALAGGIDDVSAAVSINLLGNAYSATNNGDGTWSLDSGLINELSEGNYTFEAIAVDGNGQRDTASATLIIDLTPPSVVVDELLTSTPSPSLSGTVDDFQASISVTVAGVSYTAT